MNIIVDSCFWIALYDAREEDYEWAEETWNKLQNGNKFLVPYPTMYEFINTRLMKREKSVLSLRSCLTRMWLSGYRMSNIRRMRYE